MYIEINEVIDYNEDRLRRHFEKRHAENPDLYPTYEEYLQRFEDTIMEMQAFNGYLLSGKMKMKNLDWYLLKGKW